MRTSQSGLEFITEHEGLRLDAYQDQAGLWTIGVGHLIRPFETHLQGAPITNAQAMELLREDVKTAETDVRNALKIEVNQNQFDSLVSIAFNLGGPQFRSSTFIKRINASDSRERITEAWHRWNKYTDESGNLAVSRGLHLRRIAETNLYFKSEDQKKKS